MNVWHGSYVEIRQIDLSRCEPHRDFGQGFYVTQYRTQAEFWAKRRGRNRGGGVVTEFEFHYSELVTRNCKILRFESYNEEWLDFVVMNRNDEIPSPAHDYDIVEGPVADDKVQNRIADYLKGLIGKADFLEELKWHEPTHQICFCTVASLVFLQRPDQIRVSLIAHIGEPIVERLILDHGMDEQTAGDKFFSSETFARLSDESTALYQKPWREIYEMLKGELNI
jgi:hypothetical protein